MTIIGTEPLVGQEINNGGFHNRESPWFIAFAVIIIGAVLSAEGLFTNLAIRKPLVTEPRTDGKL